MFNLGNAHEREKDNHIDSGKSMKGPSNRKRIVVCNKHIVPFLFCEYIWVMSEPSPATVSMEISLESVA